MEIICIPNIPTLAAIIKDIMYCKSLSYNYKIQTCFRKKKLLMQHSSYSGKWNTRPPILKSIFIQFSLRGLRVKKPDIIQTALCNASVSARVPTTCLPHTALTFLPRFCKLLPGQWKPVFPHQHLLQFVLLYQLH